MPNPPRVKNHLYLNTAVQYISTYLGGLSIETVHAVMVSDMFDVSRPLAELSINKPRGETHLRCIVNYDMFMTGSWQGGRAGSSTA